MASPGRPSKLTPEVKTKLIEAIKAGSHYEPACACAGVSYEAFREWIQRGLGKHPTRKPTPEYCEFAQAVIRAEGQGEINAVAAIKAASKEDWRAAAWMLERRHSTRWANTQRIQLQVEQQVTEELNMIYEAIASNPSFTDEQRKEIFTTVAKVQGQAMMAGEN